MVLSQMGALHSTLVYLIFLHSFNTVAYKDQEWSKATATYAKDTEGSLITEGACGYGDLHKASYGKHSVGLSTILFNRGTTCGACYEIRCVDHILWCVLGSPSVIVTATDFCPPNYGLSVDYGGWCNFPRQHFELSQPAFSEIAKTKADIIPVQYRRVKCERSGGMKFTMSGSSHFYQVLITNVGQEGEVFAVKVKGSRTGWIPMARNWGMNWHCNVNLQHQPLSFKVTSSTGKTLASYNVAPSNWQFGQTFQGKQF
ncbi:expansin-A20 [Lathyrus oleraceus]|uniref:Expansin n=1 Tax=Pisum sativum TaxID=3888 RepID=A0A9D5AN46_PEA|nr:expansin-A20-like [Pisum sativum]KAI5411965.1 Expansin-A20 [Pisum sativum]